MSSINFSLLLTEQNEVIEQKILKAFVEEVNLSISSKINSITNKIRQATFNFIQTTETYYSLINGDLAGHFGIPDSNRESNIDTILSTIINNMEISFSPFKIMGTNITHGLTISVLIQNFSDILALPQATVITEDGDALAWLEWLLMAGDRIIITEYEADIRPGQGRSGLGIMEPNSSAVWRVPPEFAGTANDNWLTRAFITNSNAYLTILDNIIKTELQGI